MIGRLLVAGSLGALLWHVAGRRRRTVERAAVGYADGTSVVLDPGAPELGRLLAVARGVLPG